MVCDALVSKSLKLFFQLFFSDNSEFYATRVNRKTTTYITTYRRQNKITKQPDEQMGKINQLNQYENESGQRLKMAGIKMKMLLY